MKFLETSIEGAYVLQPHFRTDSRGFFGRLFCAYDFENMGLNSRWVQINNSFSEQKGTLRGLHYQAAAHEETKLVRCVQGAIWDVVLDLRASSPTFKQWYAHELTAENRLMMYVPQGCAHGCISLQDQTELIYFVSTFYHSDFECGVRWDDPAFGIRWPIHPTTISEKDLAHLDYGEK